jgi:hypothetical protein
VLTIELFFIVGLTTVLVLGQSVPKALKYEKPINHWYSMVKEIFRLAPRKALARLSWALLAGVVVFSILGNATEKDGKLIICESTLAQILAAINILIFFFSIFALTLGKNKRMLENEWFEIRLAAHRHLYGKFPEYDEYGNFLEDFPKIKKKNDNHYFN